VAESVLLNFNYISMHQRCTLILRSLYVEFSPEIEIYTAEKGRKLANENEKLLMVPETRLVNRIFEIENSCVGTENDACRWSLRNWSVLCSHLSQQRKVLKLTR
jgi:hypothetical protein